MRARLHCVCRSSPSPPPPPQKAPQPYTVFQAVPYRVPTLKDIDELLEISINLPHHAKDDWFLSNGINYKNVTLYYDTVSRLNRAYARSSTSLHQHIQSLDFLPAPFRALYIYLLLMLEVCK